MRTYAQLTRPALGGERDGAIAGRPGVARSVRMLRLLDVLWGDRRIGTAVVVVVSALSGLVLALAMPRGPITAAQAFS